MARTFGYCTQGNQTITVSGITSSTSTPVMRSYPSCTITVYNAGTITLSTIYSDNSSTPLANPFTASSFGYWFFYGANGRYDVKLSGGGLPAPLTLFDVILTDPANFSAGVTSFNTRTGAVVPASGDYSFSMISGNITAHTHLSNSQGGQLAEGALSLSNVATNNATTGRHGFLKILSNVATEYMDGTGNWSTPSFSAPVTSVFGRTGAVVAVTNDYDFTQINGTNAVNKGGTGATTLTGILEGHGTSAFTANAASQALKYLRSKPNVVTAAYEFASILPVNAADYTFTLTPGGSVAVGANSITVAPCPGGVNGTDTDHPIRLSGGVGTAETVTISGGSCTSGAASGTIGFTAANTHTGAWTITSATCGSKEAFTANGDGSFVIIPAGTCSISGPDGLVVDKANVTLMGAGDSALLQALATESIASVVQVKAQVGKGLKLINVKVDGNRTNTGTDPAAGNGVLLKGNAGGPGGLGASDIQLLGVTVVDAANGVNVANTGGYVSNVLIANSKITAGTGAGQIAVEVDTDAQKVSIENVDLSGSDTYVDDNSSYGVVLANNFPWDANKPSAGSVASAATLTLRCGQSATVTGAIAIETITVQGGITDTSGCSVTLIPDLAATWVTSTLGNIGQSSVVVPGVALTLTSDGTSFWPSY